MDRFQTLSIYLKIWDTYFHKQGHNMSFNRPYSGPPESIKIPDTYFNYLTLLIYMKDALKFV